MRLGLSTGRTLGFEIFGSETLRLRVESETLGLRVGTGRTLGLGSETFRLRVEIGKTLGVLSLKLL